MCANPRLPKIIWPFTQNTLIFYLALVDCFNGEKHWQLEEQL